MKEYTLLAAASVVITIFIDQKSGVKILKRGEFYIFFSVIILFKLLVNGYLTARGIVLYNPDFYLGLRFGSIPLEDFLFGFSMVTQSLVFWEYFKKKEMR